MEEVEYLKLIEDSWKRRRKIHSKKTHDYATQDVLSNFKRVSQIIEILGVDPRTPHGMACVYIILKMDRFCNLTFRKSKDLPSNEAVEDTIDDWKNYLDLLEANWLEYKRTLLTTPTK
jgi:F0F1-type ATP synthase beta subunit